MAKTILAFLLTIVGVALIMGRQGGDATAAPAATLVLREGQSVALRAAGDTPWQGPGMKPGSVAVFCGEDGFAVGRLNDYYFGLNGHTAQWSETAKIVLPSGTERRLWKPERQQFVRIGAIETGADPLDFNRPFDAGRDLARQHCGG